MAPVLWREPFNHRDWLFELKLDGFRALAFIERGQVGLPPLPSTVDGFRDQFSGWLLS
jgi:hypothetical protein